MGPIHKSKVAETVPMLCLWECRNKVTFMTQKINYVRKLPFEVWKTAPV